MLRKVGSRVGAILKADEDGVHLLGYGTYQGPQPIPEGVPGGMCIPGIPNPKILLDSGKTVWGCQCWWSSEEETKRMIGDRNVIDVDPDSLATMMGES